MQWIIDSEQKLNIVADEILNQAESGFSKRHSATILALKGDLGAGKTAFTKHIAKKLGITEIITSPTFVIEKFFKIPAESKSNFGQLIHIDSYRIDLSSELLRLGWTDILNQNKNLIVIEWPENVCDILPEKYFQINFEHVNETTRKLSLVKKYEE